MDHPPQLVQYCNMARLALFTFRRRIRSGTCRIKIGSSALGHGARSRAGHAVSRMDKLGGGHRRHERASASGSIHSFLRSRKARPPTGARVLDRADCPQGERDQAAD
eukprot:6489614-Pyramimonas_sp.AAC.1